MNYNKIIFFAIAICASLLIAAINMKSYNPTPANFEGYEKAWAEVQKFENEGLPKSALGKVEEILAFAKQENNGEQTLKAVIHKCKYTVQVQEEGAAKSIQIAEEELKGLKGESANVMQSLLAEMYWNFYQQNRWKFNDRTQTVAFQNDDILTWDVATLFEKARSLYIASLENTQALKQTPITKYKDILIEGDAYARLLRPTLYDFLAHRALDFLMNDEVYLTQPTYNFEITDETIFADDKTFANHNFISTDSLSRKLLALQILQDLTKLHLQDPYATALTDVNLKRLHFAKENARLDNKDSLYLQSLFVHDKKYERDSSSTRYLFEIANYHRNLASKYQPLVSDEFKTENKTSIAFCNKAIERAKESYGAKNCAALKTQIEYKSLQVTAEKVVTPGLPSRMLVSWKNVDTTYIKIVKLTEADRTNTYLLNTTEKITYYTKLPAVKNWMQTLPDDGDYNQHSVEIKIPELEQGAYALMISENKNFVLAGNGISLAQFWVSNIAYIENRIDDGSMEFYVLDRTSGEPLKGATVQTYKKDYDYNTRKYNKNKSKTYKTDDRGYFKLDEFAGKNYESVSFKICCSGDTLDTDNDFYLSKPYKQNKYNQRTTYFFTDRSIYRPGQTIYFKGIVVEQDENGKPLQLITGQKTEVTFYDVNDEEVATLELQTNDYGSFSGSFTAPTGLLNGQMRISDGYGDTYISVEEYKRPKFYVEFAEVKGSFVLNDSIIVNGNAVAYSGNNIDNAKVSYRVVRNASFPYWYDYFWWRPYPSSPQMEIAHGETVTDASGKFSIHFKAIPDANIAKNEKPQFTYTVYADVIDLNGETRSGQTSASVGYISQLIDISVPQTINKDSVQKLIINSTNLNYAFEPASGTISIHKLNSPERLFRNRLWQQADKYVMSEEEYHKLFPHDIYKNENDEHTWQTENQTASINFNTADTNLVEIDAAKWEEGFYKLILKSTDKKTGEEIKKEQYFYVRSSDGKYVPEKYIYSPETYFTAEPGKTIDIKVSSAIDVHALYVLHFRDKILESRWMEIDEEQKSIPVNIKEEYRGGLQAELIFIRDNQVHQQTWNIHVPWTNKDLKVSFETFRNKLEPGSKETWKIKIEGKNGEKVAAEFLASMYDASLDAFKTHGWNFIYWPSYYNYKYWGAGDAFGLAQNYGWFDTWNVYANFQSVNYDYLNWFGLSFYSYNYVQRGSGMLYLMDGAVVKSAAPEMALEEVHVNGKLKSADKKSAESVSTTETTSIENTQSANSLTGVTVRSNLNETAFFYPHLETDSSGAVIFSFTMPEALTKWNFMGLAHTKNLQSGQIMYPIITQKELMVVPNVPRFLREGDEISLTAKVSNLTNGVLEGMASLEIFDAVTMQPLDAQFANLEKMIPISVPAKQSIPLSWKIKVPEGVQAIVYRVRAKGVSPLEGGKGGDTFSDGEENALPVLTNRMLVTESLPLPIRWGQTKTFSFDKLVNSNSSSLQHQNLTLEFTSNPAWYAVQALPYMMEYPYECAEQLFNRYYSNSIAGHVANSSPKIKAVFDSWKNSPDALVSTLEKNQELKSLLLEETPWVLQAKDETERKKRVGLLFDLNKMSNEKNAALNKLINMQTSNGGFSWFAGMPDDRYITQYIVSGIGHLQTLGIEKNSKLDNVLYRAVQYVDARMYEDYLDLEKYLPEGQAGKIDKEKYVPSGYIVQYLYARSYFNNMDMNAEMLAAKNYYLGQIKKYWLQYGLYEKGMISLMLEKNNEHETAMKIIASLKEFSLNKEELGMYWKDNVSGYYWYQAPIETQAMMIEAFDVVAKDYKAVEDMKVWLLKQKQTTDWKTTRATAEACYALLLRGTELLASDEIATILVGGKNVSTTNTEAGTGYFKTSWNKNEINSSLGNITVTAPSNNNQTGGVSWGAMYWQYFEDLDKITPAETPLQLNKKLFIKKITDKGEQLIPVNEKTQLHVGDLVTVRIELRSDRDMEYIHMKDMRASCFEPVNVLSGYKWQDGLGYYESTKDAATNFFMNYLRKGTYVFEYDLRVAFTGDFSNGITSIQCMYAPEFTSHSEGIRVQVK